MLFLFIGNQSTRSQEVDRGVWAADRAARRSRRGSAAGGADVRDRLAGEEGRRRGQVRHTEIHVRKVDSAVFSSN